MTLLPLMLSAVLGLANAAPTSTPAAAPNAPTIERITPTCVKCHDSAEHTMKGKHSQVANPNNPSQYVTCTNCHGNITRTHRRAPTDVMRFGKDFQPLDQQNGVCLTCHKPEKLREALWAHDVHVTKLMCTACHTLHPEKEPMIGIPASERIKLCVDCHGKQHAAKEKAAAEAAKAPTAPAPVEQPATAATPATATKEAP